MVAANEPQKPKSQIKAHKRSHPQRRHWEINPAVEAKARTLYLVRGMPPSAVAAELGVQPKAISDLASRRGWCKVRREVWQESDKASQAALSADVSRVMQGIALESEELTVGSLQLARESIEAKDAKSLSMSSSAIRNLVEVSRRIRGLDQQQTGLLGGNVNFFVLQGVPQADKPTREPVNVTPSVASSAITDTPIVV